MKVTLDISQLIRIGLGYNNTFINMNVEINYPHLRKTYKSSCAYKDEKTQVCEFDFNSINVDSRHDEEIEIILDHPRVEIGRVFIKADFSNTGASRPRALGDVVARDLKSKIAGTLGHVALWTGTKILEVNDVNPAIRKISFNDYNKTKYWGARYGKGSRAQAIKAINAGWAQRKFNPKYTIFAGKTTEGGINKTIRYPRFSFGFGGFRIEWITFTYTTEARFRCDTFVKYSYMKAGINLGSASLLSPTTPSSVFNSMPKKR